MDTEVLFHQLIKPGFDWKGISEYTTLVGLAQEAVALKDLPQRILGKIVLQLDTESYGTLKAFAQEIGVSGHVLKIYAWVERKLDKLEIPSDIPWSSLRVIAGTNNPKKWVDRINEEGLSFAEVKRLVMEEKGIEPQEKHKIHKCGNCGFEAEGLKCPACQNLID